MQQTFRHPASNTPPITAAELPPTPTGNGGVGHSNDQVDINVQSMEQHVHQHAPEPRDLDYRVHALSLAISSRLDYFSASHLIGQAAELENYLRNGADK